MWFGLKWEEVGWTEGVTVTHLSKLTVDYMRQLGIEKYGVRRINRVFGEGSSPRTRQIKEGLNLIGINNHKTLTQSNGRGVYACELFPGAREALIGFANPKARKALSAPTIARAWIERWLTRRITQPEVIARVREAGAPPLARNRRSGRRTGEWSQRNQLRAK
jgi:hypothetical protein